MTAENSRPALIVAANQTGRLANGGVESVTQVLTRLQHFRPVVVTQRESAVNGRWEAQGAEVHVWPEYSRGGRLSRPLYLARENARMFRLVRRVGARVVHCNDLRSLWAYAIGARMAGAQVVFNLRDIKRPDEGYRAHWALAQHAQRIIVLSQEMREAVVRRLPRSPFTAVPPVDAVYSVVDRTRMRPLPAAERVRLRQELGIGGDERLIAYVAAIGPKKAQWRFIEKAGPLLAALPHRVRVAFVGDADPSDEYARRCREAVMSAGLEKHLQFVGYSAQPERWYQASDLTVVASEQEGLARCMIESIACGTPVVSFDVCSAREILEGHHCGLVVRQGDYAGLVDAIAELLVDDVSRRRLGANGAAAAERLFDAGSVTARYEAIYRELAAGEGGEA